MCGVTDHNSHFRDLHHAWKLREAAQLYINALWRMEAITSHTGFNPPWETETQSCFPLHSTQTKQLKRRLPQLPNVRRHSLNKLLWHAGAKRCLENTWETWHLQRQLEKINNQFEDLNYVQTHPLDSGSQKIRDCLFECTMSQWNDNLARALYGTGLWLAASHTALHWALIFMFLFLAG